MHICFFLRFMTIYPLPFYAGSGQSLNHIGDATIHKTKLCLLKGSIIDSDADAIVNSTDRKLSMAGKKLRLSFTCFCM